MKEYLNEFYLPFPQSFTYSQDIDYYLYEEYTKELENVWLEGRQLFRDYCLQFAEQIIFSRKNNVHIAALYSPGIPEPVDLSCDRKPNLLAAHNITQLPLDLQEVSLEFQSITLYQEYPKLMLKKKKDYAIKSNFLQWYIETNIHRYVQLSSSSGPLTKTKHLHRRKVKVRVAQLYLIVCDPMDYTVHGIIQARILEWVAVPFCKGSSQPRD